MAASAGRNRQRPENLRCAASTDQFPPGSFARWAAWPGWDSYKNSGFGKLDCSKRETGWHRNFGRGAAGLARLNWHDRSCRASLNPLKNILSDRGGDLPDFGFGKLHFTEVETSERLERIDGRPRSLNPFVPS